MEQQSDSGLSGESSEDIVQPILCQVLEDIPSHNQLDGMAEEHEEVSNDIEEIPQEVQVDKVTLIIYNSWKFYLAHFYVLYLFLESKHFTDKFRSDSSVTDGKPLKCSIKFSSNEHNGFF